MGLKKIAAKLFAQIVYPKLLRDNMDAERIQEKLRSKLVHDAKNTAFGIQHEFDTIKSAKDFSYKVPLRDYEQLKPFIDLALKGQSDVLWPGKPLYFAKTSGTTSGAKYIPLTKASMPSHISAARNALLAYIYHGGNADFVNGKMIFLQGSPILEKKNGISFGRLSGIVAHYVPAYLQKNRMPSMETNCIEPWERKVDAIVQETLSSDMRLISGIPPWVKMYYERLIAAGGVENVSALFKNLSLFVYGGVNFEPYRSTLENLLGKKIDSIELFPASEGFFAFQDRINEKGMLLNTNAGIYFEFIEQAHWEDENPPRLNISQIKVGVNYALVVSSNAGLWAYNVGDVIQFTQTKPYRVVVTGRTKHFTSAFGEHVIAAEVESAMLEAIKSHPAKIVDFHVAPLTTPDDGMLPRHQWLVEFHEKPENVEAFAQVLQEAMLKQNVYYADLNQGNVLQKLELIILKNKCFEHAMNADGKLGGQNKAPRLANNRNFADKLLEQTRK